MESIINTTVSQYRILEKLGEGGMGVVYKAEDTRLKRTVVLKFLPPHLTGDPEAKARFITEAQAASALDHPNICTIFDIKEADDGQMYIIMAYYNGETLRERVARGREHGAKDGGSSGGIEVAETIEIASQIAAGLARAHEAGITHRDIKPSNIMITRRGEVKILDFGIARIAGQKAITKTGSTLGTVAYMSPEQVQARLTDHRTDIWSLGVVLYEMLTGEQPFKGEFDQVVMYSIVNDEPAPVSKLQPEMAVELEQIVEGALQKDTDERYQHVDEMLADLRQSRFAVTGSERAHTVGTSRFSPKHSQKKWELTDLAIVVIAMLAIGIFSGIFRSDSPIVLDERIMLAVLPFENLGAAEESYFVDGMTEEITNKLASIYDLGVISRTTAMQYKQTDKTISEIGNELGVDYILEGSVRWQEPLLASNRVLVAPKLIRVSDESHIWTDSYDKVIEDIFELQSDIALAVARQLDLVLLQPERRAINARPTTSLEAYDCYTQSAIHLEIGWQNWDEGEHQKAIELLERAVDLDPGFINAYLRLFHTLRQLKSLQNVPNPVLHEQARAALDSALHRAPDLPEVQLAEAYYYHTFARDFDRALEIFESVQKARPNLSPALLGFLQRHKGKWHESSITLENAFYQRPRNYNLAVQLAFNHQFMRNFAEAEYWFKRSLQIESENQTVKLAIAANHVLWNGDTREALAILEALPDDPDVNLVRLYTYRVERSYADMLALLDSVSYDRYQGQTAYFQKNLAYASVYYYQKELDLMRVQADSAGKILEKLVQENPDNPWWRAALGLAYAYMGSKDDAIRSGVRATELVPVSRTHLYGPFQLINLAEIHAVVGEHQAAIEQIDYLLSVPCEFSISLLHKDPMWDSLRDQTGFQELLRKYSKNDH